MKTKELVQIIIFSYNRALQLDALLSSIKKNWKNIKYHIDIIYNSSDNTYESGYDLLKQKTFDSEKNISYYKEQAIRFPQWTIKELTDIYNLKLLYLCPFLRHAKTTFRKQLLHVLKESKAEHVMFLTDDSIFIKPVQLSSQNLSWINEAPFHNQISMRHGIETLGSKDLNYTGEQYHWDFSKYSSNDHWGYRFSLDAHIYHREAILKTLSNISFSNPNTLESSGMLHTNKKGLFNKGKCFKNMSILSFPINIVQTTFKNEALKASPDVLNEYYLNGYHLEYPLTENFQTFQIYPNQIYLVKDKECISLSIK